MSSSTSSCQIVIAVMVAVVAAVVVGVVVVAEAEVKVVALPLRNKCLQKNCSKLKSRASTAFRHKTRRRHTASTTSFQVVEE